MRLAVKETEAENLFETLADKSPVGLCIIQDGKFCYTNPTFQHNTGYREDELLDKDSLELIIPEDRVIARENAMKMLKGELTLPYQFRVTHKNGSIKWVMESVASVQYRGRPATLGNFIDITAHKQTDEALQAEKNKLQSLIDAMEYTLTIQDREYNIIYQNELSKIASGGDHLGEKCYRVYEGREEICDGCPVEKAFKDGKSHTAERRTAIAGEVAFWENTANPIRDAEGRVVSCLELTKNITERKKAEEELSKTQAQLSTAVQMAHLGPWEYDAINDLFIFSDAFYAIFHTTAEEVGGYTMSSAEYARRFVYPEDAPLVGVEVRKALQADDPSFSRQLDHRIIYADGEVGYISVRFFIVKDETGSTVRTYGVNQDITERKQAEEALRQSEEKYRALFDSSVVGTFIIDAETMKVMMTNRAAAKTFGFSSVEEGIGVNPLDFFQPEDRERVFKIIMKDMFEQDLRQTNEFRVMTKDGREIWISAVGTRIMHEGRLAGLISFTDITERKQAEEAWREAEEEKSALLEEAPIAVISADLKGKITYANKRFESESGYSREEIVGKNGLKLDWLPAGTIRYLTQRMAARLRGGPSKHWETQFKCKDGRWIWVAIEGKVLRRLRVPVGFQIIARDITERKLTEEKVQHFNLVLHAIRNINKLIARGSDRDSLLKGACDNFVKNRGYYSAWIALLDESGKLVTAAEAGLGKSFLQVMERLKRGELTPCGCKVLEKPGVLVMKDVSSECEGCPLAKEDTGRDAMSIRLEHGGKVYGLMTVSIPPGRAAEKEEHGLFEEIAGDIAFALHSIEQEQERKRVEKALRDSEEKLRKIFESATDGILVINLKGIITEVNQRTVEMHGFSSKDELRGKDALELLAPRDHKRVAANMRKAIKEGTIRGVEYTLLKADGTEFPGELSTNVLKDASGNPVGHISIARDITERKKQEEELQAERNKLQSIIDAMADGLTIQDGDYNIIYEGRLQRTIFGDHVGEKCYRVYEGRESICEGCPVEKAFKDGKSHTSERRTVTPSGEVVFWENTANPIRDARGEIVSCLEIARNITERKRAEEELRLLSSVTQQVSDAILVTNLGHNITYVNKAAEELFGCPAQEMLGKHVDAFNVEIPPESFKQEVEQTVSSGKTWVGTLVKKRKDGSTFLCECHISPLYDKQGKISSHIDVLCDITERKQAEEALQTERNKLQSLIDAMEDGISIQDTEYNIIFQNEPSRKSTGGDHVGEKCYRVYEGRESICEDCPVEKSFKDGKPHTSERQRVLPSGELSFWENTSNPIRDAKREVVACLEIGRNITERRKQEQALADELTRRRLLVDQSLDGIVVIDENDKVYEANQRFAEMLGYTPEEVHELHTWDWDKNFPPEKIHELGRKADEKGFLLETTHTRKDGSVIDVDISINASMFGGQKLIFCVCRDVTERKKAEQALADELTRRRLLVDQSLDGIVVLDVDAKVVEANQRFAEMLGYTLEEVRELHTWDWDKNFPPEQILEMGRGIDEKGRHLETKHTRKDGSVIDVDISISGIMYGGRKLIFCIQRDITERKKMEEAINLQRAYFQQLFDTSPDAIIMMDANDRAIQANRGFEVLFGYSNEEVKARSLIELIVPEVDVQEASDSLQRISGGEVVRKESVRRRKDGSLVDVSVLAYPIRFNDKLVGTYGVYSDITERKQAEEAIKHAAEEWRDTFDSISDAISIHDREYKILRANKAFADIFHMKPRQIIGRYCYELHSGEKPISGCPHKQTLATGKPAAAEFYESNLGKYLRESTSPIFDEKGEVVGTIHITRDITEQKQQNERLMMADRLASIGELAAGTAHELNNPLTSVLGFSQLVMEKDIPDDIREDLKLIHNEAQRAASVTKNLLTFARKQAPAKQLNQINNIIEDVLKLRAYEHKVNGIEVQRQLAPDLPEIKVDYSQMQQVFLNIIINAEYFMIEAHNRGTLTVTTKKRNGSVRISIADDGPGIPPETLSRIFNPFFTTKEAGKGTGLGLSICHGIVSEHGGQIYARSRPGKGATIVVELPTNNH